MRSANTTDSRLHDRSFALSRRALAGVASAARSAAWSVAARLTAPAAPVGRRAVVQRLEDRRLLVVLLPGETFTYSTIDFEELPEDADDFITARLTVQGGSEDTTVELFGSTAGGELSGMSGVISGSSIPDRNGPVRGGLGGVIGTVPIGVGAAGRTDYLGRFGPGSVLQAPQGDAIAFEKIDANDDGLTFGVQLYDNDVLGVGLDVVLFNTDPEDTTRSSLAGPITDATPGSTGDAIFLNNILGQIVAALNAAPDTNPQLRQNGPDDNVDPLEEDDINSIFGFAFEPGGATNVAYIGLSVTTRRENPNPTGPNNQFVDAATPVLMSITFNPADLRQTSVAYIASDFSSNQQSNDAGVLAEIENMTVVGASQGSSIPEFALIGTFRERLNENTALETVDERRGLVLVQAPTGRVSQNFRARADTINFFGEDEGAFVDIEFRPTDGRIYGLTEPGEDQSLQSIPITSARNNQPQVINAALVGGTRNVGVADRVEEQNTLTFDPTRPNPFTGATGSFLTFDTGVDELQELDPRPRGVGGALSLYSIVVSNGDPQSTTIVVTALDNDGNPTGLSGDVGPVFAPQLQEIQGPDHGELYLGLKYVVNPPVGDPFLVTRATLDIDNPTEGTAPYSGPTLSGEVVPGFYALDGGVEGFLFGGVVTGAVRVEGSLNRFIAGSILTGGGLGGPDTIDNFAVYGDVGTIFTTASIGDIEFEDALSSGEVFDPFGDDPDLTPFRSGTDFAIGGRLNAVRTPGSINATFDIRGDREPEGGFEADTFFQALPLEYFSVENDVGGRQEDIREAFALGSPSIPQLFNNTFATYEPVNTLPDGSRRIFGSLNNPPRFVDAIDFYGIGLMAGQTVEVGIATLAGESVSLGVFDPDGVLVASSFDNNPETRFLSATSPFRFTTDVPGTYRLAVNYTALGNFVGGGRLSSSEYVIDIRNAGDVVVGGVVAGRRIAADRQLGDSFFSRANQFVGATDNFRVRLGDVGIIEAREESYYDGGAGSILRVVEGHLRSLSGSGVGAQGGAIPGNVVPVNLRVGHSIGRLQATGIGDPVYGGDVFVNFFGVEDFGGRALATEVAAGDDIQLVQAARDVYGNFTVGRGIGSIVAGRDWGNQFVSLADARIFVNVDGINDDGFVDMFSVGGNVGVSSGSARVIGGPAIDVGVGGNFRYMDIPEGALVIRDRFFGSFQSEPFNALDSGERFDYTDDSGTRVRITPDPGTINPFFNPAVDPPEFEFLNQGTLEVLTYPVRSGGSILASVRSNRGFTIDNRDRGERAVAEVGNIFLTGAGGRPVLNAVNADGFSLGTNFGLSDPDPFNVGIDGDGLLDNDVIFNGSRYDLFNVQTSTPDADGRISRLVNNTSGEILSARLTSIGELRAPFLGIANPRGLGQLRVANPAAFGRVGLPFHPQLAHVIAVEGSIVSIEGDSIGNIFAGADLGIDEVEDAEFGGFQNVEPVGVAGDGIGGTARAGGVGSFESPGGFGGAGLPLVGEVRAVIGEIRANAFGGRGAGDRFAGIAGPIVASRADSSVGGGGEIRRVDIGEGIADDGSGDFPRAGLYAEGFIVEVVGTDADIRGEIIANEINSIRLTNGSLLGADILQPGLVDDDSINFGVGNERIDIGEDVQVIGVRPDLIEDPFFEIDEIVITGGGILGSFISISDVDTIRVDGGFGIQRSAIGTGLVDGVINRVETSNNFGIRNTFISAGTNVRTVRAGGDGELVPLSQVPVSARLADTGRTFDPFSGRELNAATDVRLSLGIPGDVDTRRRLSNSGVIENTVVTGSRDLGTYEAVVSRVNASSAFGFGEDTATLIGLGDTDAPSFLNRVAFGRNVEGVNVTSTEGLQLTAGDLRRVTANRDLINTLLRVSGRVEEVNVAGAIFGNSRILAEGPDGSIGTVTAGDLFGLVRADQSIGTVAVAGDLGSPTGQPVVLPSREGTIRAGGDISPNAPIGRISVGGDILTGVFILASGVLDELFVGGDIEEGAVVEALQINTLDVDGRIFGEVIRR